MDSFGDYLFTQGILGVVVAACIVVIVYQQKKNDKKDDIIQSLHAQLLAEAKSHATDYRELVKDNQEVIGGTTQAMALFGEKIEVVKGRQK